MCFQTGREALFSRSSFLALAGAAAAPLLLDDEARAAAAPLPATPSGLSAGNRRAAEIARQSPFARRNYERAMQLARSIGDARLREHILNLIEQPVPTYARRYDSAEKRVALRDALAREGFVAADAPVSGIFPPGTQNGRIVQPFWSAAGSDLDSHHSYPGGLLAHELFNASIAQRFAQTYDAIYFDGASKVQRDTVIAAAFYHDIMKTVVFQFNENGTLLPELEIGATGGHHCLSGAEAIVRGQDARFVTVQLSAHAAPSLGDQTKVVTWCRASAMIAGVDPVEYGLLAKRDGEYVLAALPPIEAFVNHLSDHDYVLTVPAVQTIAPRLARVNPSLWYRHEVLARDSAVALYQKLANAT